MRDLPFLLRLHALPPLARFPRIHLKPYLPLEVRYLIRSTGEVLLYVSNDLSRQTSYEALSLFASESFEINTLIPSAGNIPLLLNFLPRPTGIYSHLTNDYVFLGMLCRRGLACHYLPLYEARWRPPYEYPSQENIVLPQTEQYAFLQPIFLLLFILSVFGVGCLACYDIMTSIIFRGK